MLGEIFASRGGLGFLLSAADQTFDVQRVNAVIVVLAIIGVGVNLLFNVLERRIAPVSGSERQATLAGYHYERIARMKQPSTNVHDLRLAAAAAMTLRCASGCGGTHARSTSPCTHYPEQDYALADHRRAKIG